MKNIVFTCLDCEMTGLDIENDRIIEIAAVKFTLERELNSFETLVNPGKAISLESKKIHHISDEMLEGKPLIKDILPKLSEFIGKDPIIVGHSVSCDLDMLMQEGKRVDQPFTTNNYTIIDTLRLAKDYGNSPNNSLESLSLHFNVPLFGSHRAMNDVRANIGVFKHLIKRYKNLNHILEVLSKPIRIKQMPLGKHKGRAFSEIPLSYLQWAKKMDFDEDLLFSIRQELKNRQKGTSFTQSGNPFFDL